MSAEWQTQGAESWKITLPCTRAESEELAGDVPAIAGLEPQPVLMTSEPDPDQPDAWQLDVYLEQKPDAALIELLRGLVPSAAGVAPVIERIEDQDWVTISQAWLEPIQAGRFHVHTAAHAGNAPADAIAFHIEASRAFGTGHHETTTGCLMMLDQIERAGGAFINIADIGTGTGLLAFAARTLWPHARIIASDIDPISIDVTAENMAANDIPADAIALVAADGMDDPALVAAAPYDLIIANILAGPLIELAPSFARASAPGATIILAGLLASQADDVLAAFAQHRFVESQRVVRGEWPTLALVQQA